MAKTCPATGEPVLYIDCADCEERAECGKKKKTGNSDEFALLIVGSRTITDYGFIKRKADILLSQAAGKYRITVVSGGAQGVDALAKRYAEEKGYGFVCMPAEWKKYGKRAGYIRNEAMHGYIAGFEHRGCIMFWDGESKGTMHSIGLAEKYGNPLRLVRVYSKA